MRLDEIEAYTSVERSNIIKRYEPLLKFYANTNYQIYRGMYNTSPIIFGNGNNMNRRSANTQNYYTLLIDNNAKWNEFPKRSKSFICSTDTNNASMYGKTYLVIPLENQPIGICPENDFWWSFKLGNPSDLNAELNNLASWCKINKLSEISYNILMSQLAKIDTIAIKLFDDEDMLEEAKYNCSILYEMGYFEEFNLMAVLSKFYDPKLNNFKLQHDVKGEVDKEVWLSGKVLFIELENEWPEILEELGIG